jgi:hypothetical protein
METVTVIVIIAAAAAYTVRAIYRAAGTGNKSCGCEKGCPISESCDPDDNRCVAPEEKNADMTDVAAVGKRSREAAK